MVSILIVVLVGRVGLPPSGWVFMLGVVVLICASGICFNYDAFRAQNLGIWLGLVLRWIRSRVIVMISFWFACFAFSRFWSVEKPPFSLFPLFFQQLGAMTTNDQVTLFFFFIFTSNTTLIVPNKNTKHRARCCKLYHRSWRAGFCVCPR